MKTGKAEVMFVSLIPMINGFEEKLRHPLAYESTSLVYFCLMFFIFESK